jgi:hypothetical protein
MSQWRRYALRAGLSAMVLSLLGLSAFLPAVAQNRAPSPVIIELFTAEGCSSCPPADAFLRQLDVSQPIPGAQLIVLSEHVNYWDQGGWPDPYSSDSLTNRQRAYVHSLRLSEAYTPQFIVDGSTEMRLTNRQQIPQILQQAAAAYKIAVEIGALSVQANSPAEVSGHADIDGGAEAQKSDVYVGIALDHVESKVLRGENRGQTLTHVAVVRDLVKIGTLSPGQHLSPDFRVPLKPATDPANLRVIVFVQESGSRKIVGAALRRTADQRG